MDIKYYKLVCDILSNSKVSSEEKRQYYERLFTSLTNEEASILLRTAYRLFSTGENFQEVMCPNCFGKGRFLSFQEWLQKHNAININYDGGMAEAEQRYYFHSICPNCAGTGIIYVKEDKLIDENYIPNIVTDFIKETE